MTPIHQIGCLALRYAYQIPSRRKYAAFAVQSTFRFLHTESDDDRERPKQYVFDVSSLSPEARHQYKYLSPDEKKEYAKASQQIHVHMTSPEVETKLQAVVEAAIHEVAATVPPSDVHSPPAKRGFFSIGEEDAEGTGEDEEFEGDDITSLAHGELEQHRELREYARIAAWEMPLLSRPSSMTHPSTGSLADLFIELAKPFSPPPLDHPLRFRYTTYMGETHPAAKKIALEFCTRDLPDLTEAQRVKLIKLVGPRYNPEKDLVKMSCEMFETQAQNKRYLGDLVDTLMEEAKDSTDMFEDVPLDFRHHKYKPKLEFPDAWKLTPERKQQLEAERQHSFLAEREREEKGKISDGVRAIEALLKEQTVQDPSRVPVVVKQLKGRVRRSAL